MGNDPNTPLNQYSQAHDCKNLCVDGGPFVSSTIKKVVDHTGPSMRTSEYIVEDEKQNV
jgi:hypothetical protein